MPETKEKTPSVLRTVDLRYLVPQIDFYNRQKFVDIFDRIHIKVVREDCLKKLHHASVGSERTWAKERIENFFEIRDFDTVLMLLRFITGTGINSSEEEFEIILDVFERMVDEKARTPIECIKRVTVIFCGHLKESPHHYNDRARELVRGILSGGWGVIPSKEQLGIVKRLILIVTKVRDTELLPEVRKFVMPLTYPDLKLHGLDHHFEYLSISQIEIEVDAHAHRCVTYLEGLCSQ